MTTAFIGNGAKCMTQERFEVVAVTKQITSSEWRWKMLEGSNLPPLGKFILLLISLHGDEGSEGLSPTQKRLVRLSGMDERTIKKHIKAGKEWLAVEEKGTSRKHPTVYGLRIPRQTLSELEALMLERGALDVPLSQEQAAPESPSLDAPLSERGALDAPLSESKGVHGAPPFDVERGTNGASSGPLPPTPPNPDNKYYPNTRVCMREGGEQEAQKVTITEDQFETFNRVYGEWGTKPETMTIMPWAESRRTTDPILVGYVEAHSRKPAALVQDALFEVITYMACKRADEIAEEHGCRHGKAGFASYFAKALRSAVNSIAKAEAKASADETVIAETARLTIEAETAINAMKPEAFARRVEIGQQAAEKRAATGGTHARQESIAPGATRFNDNTLKIAVVKGIWIDGVTANRVLDGVSGATVMQVRDALFEADKQPEVIFTQGSVFATNARAVVAPTKIVDWCIDWLNVDAQFLNMGSAR